jgi:hypothetical protein
LAIDFSVITARSLSCWERKGLNPSYHPSEQPPEALDSPHPDIGMNTAGINVIDASLGLKYNLFARLVITGNVLLNPHFPPRAEHK